MPAPIHAKVVIIGSGPAGYTAAIYAARAMLEPVLIQGIQPGGQLTITTDVENYPGFADVIQGPWLMEQMQKQAAHVGTRMVTDHVTKVELALFLANFASKVTVVHRRDSFRAERILQDRLTKNPKISVIWDSVLHEVHGSESPLKVNAIALKNVRTGAVTKMPIDGVFIA